MLRSSLLTLGFVVFSSLCAVAQSAEPCPEITVTSPAGIVMPGEIFTFVAELKGPVPKDLSYRWTIDENGDIIDGQGTLELRAKYHQAGVGVTATIEVSGLPNKCATKASDTLSICILPAPVQLGTINDSTYTIGEEMLERIRDSLTTNEGSQLYVWLYVGSSSKSRTSSLRSRLLRQLSATKIDPSRITLQISSERAVGATFWRIPPGSENPAP